MKFGADEKTPMTTTRYATTTFTTATGKGVAPGVVGGIVAAVVVGFVLLGVTAFLLLFRKRKPTPATGYVQDASEKRPTGLVYGDYMPSDSSRYAGSINQQIRE